MLHEFLLGMTLGFGAAVPIGPINIEMIRRNINHGFWLGLMIGVGACMADVTYLCLIALGIFYFFSDQAFLKYFSYVGSLVLCWFAYQSFLRAIKPKKQSDNQKSQSKTLTLFSGYYLTLLNPMTILFWSSISFALAGSILKYPHALWVASFGVVSAIFIWIVGLNTVIHHTRHFFSETANRWLNAISGVILFGFAVFTFLR